MKNLEEVQDVMLQSGSCTIVHASPDAGKSTLMLTLSKMYKIIYFDFEGMALSVLPDIPEENKNIKNIFIPDKEDYKKVLNKKELTTLEDLDKFVDSIDSNIYNCIVLDSMSFFEARQTATTNPATLGGDGIFAHYRNLGRYTLFLIDKCKKKGLNIFITFQSTKGKKGYEGVSVPDVDGKVILNEFRDASSTILFIQKVGYKKRIVWQDTGEGFAYTKAKGLPKNHAEKIEFGGLDDFCFEKIFGDKKLPTAQDREKKQISLLKTIKDENDLRGVWDKVKDNAPTEKVMRELKEIQKKVTTKKDDEN